MVNDRWPVHGNIIACHYSANLSCITHSPQQFHHLFCTCRSNQLQVVEVLHTQLSFDSFFTADWMMTVETRWQVHCWQAVCEKLRSLYREPWVVKLCYARQLQETKTEAIAGSTHKCFSLFISNFSFISRCRWIAMFGTRRIGRSMWTRRCSTLSPDYNTTVTITLSLACWMKLQMKYHTQQQKNMSTAVRCFVLLLALTISN